MVLYYPMLLQFTANTCVCSACFALPLADVPPLRPECAPPPPPATFIEEKERAVRQDARPPRLHDAPFRHETPSSAGDRLRMDPSPRAWPMTGMGGRPFFVGRDTRDGWPASAASLSSHSSSSSSSSSLSGSFRFRIPAVQFVVSSRSSSDNVFVASASTIWMLAMPTLEAQWKSLIAQDRVYAALQWCHREQSLQRCTALAMQRCDLPETDENAALPPFSSGMGARAARVRSFLFPFQQMEHRLRLHAGFQWLYKGNIVEALYMLQGSHVDVRELLLFIPECLPADVMPACPSHRGASLSSSTSYGESYWTQYTSYAHDYTQLEPKSLQRVASRTRQNVEQAKRGFFSSRLEAVWRVTYEGSHPVSSPSTWSTAATRENLSDIPSFDSAPLFIEQRWRSLKFGMELLLQHAVEAGVLPLPQARAAAYALLVLRLERRAFTAAHHLCVCASSIVPSCTPHSIASPLLVEDAAPLLRSLGEYRLLATSLWCAGKKKSALQWMRKRLWLSAFLSLKTGASLSPMAFASTPSLGAADPLFLWTHPVYGPAAPTPVLLLPSASVSASSPSPWCEEGKKGSSSSYVGEVGCGWLALPPGFQEQTARWLFGLSFGTGTSSVRRMEAAVPTCAGPEEAERRAHTNRWRAPPAMRSPENSPSDGLRGESGWEDSDAACPGDGFTSPFRHGEECSAARWASVRGCVPCAPTTPLPSSASSLVLSRWVRVVASFYTSQRGIAQEKKDAFLATMAVHPNSPFPVARTGARSGSFSPLAARSMEVEAALPTTLSLPFVLLDHLDLPTLAEYLHANPHRACLVDEEGSGFLHLALAMLALSPPFVAAHASPPLCKRKTEDEAGSSSSSVASLEENATFSPTALHSARGEKWNGSEKEAGATGTTATRGIPTTDTTIPPSSTRVEATIPADACVVEPSRQAVLLKCITSLLAVLLFAGCPTHPITSHGLSVVDVPFVLTDNSHFEAVVSSILSLKKVAKNTPMFPSPF